MTRLLHDRYFIDTGRCAWDLATGELLPGSDPPREPDTQTSSSPALVELLEQGQDGVPRWLAADTALREGRHGVRRLAADATARGYVPIAVDMYFRLRDAIAGDLTERTLVLIAHGERSVAMARAALLDASARAPRPHLLLMFAASRPKPEGVVREARARYGAPAVLPARAASMRDVVEHVQRAERAVRYATAGRHAAAERLLRDVAAALSRRRAFAPAAQTLIALGRLLIERGRAEAADTVLDAAADAAQQSDDAALMIDARLWQAAARVDAWRLTRAESICRAVLVAPSLGDDRRAWARATLARVLLWQGRIPEAVSLDLSVRDVDDVDVVAHAYVRGTEVRCLLAADRVFEAGLRARQLVTDVGDRDPLARVIAAMAQFRAGLAAGDLVLCARLLEDVSQLARVARVPLRLLRARALWAEALSRAGRAREAAREQVSLRRFRTASPAVVRQAIDRVLSESTDPSRRPIRVAFEGIEATSATTLIHLAHDGEDDREAVRSVMEAVARSVQSSRLELSSADAGPVSTIVSVGSGLPATLGVRVIDSGIVIGPERRDGGHELGVPVRLGSRLVGALVARWPADRHPPQEASALLGLAAAVTAARIEALLTAARQTDAASTSIPELVGVSSAIADVRNAIARAARAPFSVLIEGESGVGKELVARAVHQLGPRRARRFCDVNCAALPDDLFESELFGYARGAFTGAVVERAGLFEEADGGTLFMDELADLSLRAQAKLLRVIQQQEVRRLGESFSRAVDVRLVTAANRDMRAEAAAGRFRQDLLYRLDVIRIRIPPLRERPDDIPVLAHHFWRAAAERVGTRAVLTHGVIAALSRYHWPGNVRELQNAISALAVAAPPTGRTRPQLLPAVITGVAAVTSPRMTDARVQFERRFIEVALARAAGSRSRAAREVGLSRQGLLKMMARLGIAAPATGRISGEEHGDSG